MRFAAIISLLLANPCFADPASLSGPNADDCPYLPEFKQLRGTLYGLPPVKAAAALEHYIVTHDNPEGCEFSKLDELMSKQESQLFMLHYDHEASVSQFAFRCNSVDSLTVRCTGPTEDLTAHPFDGGATVLPIPVSRDIQVASQKPEARLTSAYILRLSDALDGRPARKLKIRGATITLPVAVEDSALIVIFRTDGLWQYRKAVWYFGRAAGDNP